MKVITVEVSSKQIADLARDLAVSFGHSEPDMLVAPGPLAQVRSPCHFELYALPDRRTCVPLWRHFEPAARDMLAKVGALGGVTFVAVSDHQPAEAA